MGANFDLQNEDFKTYILHPTTGTKAYIFPDPSHMLKLARNALEAYGSFVDEDGKEIKWEYFKNLARLQKEEGLRAGNKLTTRHTDFSKQKMKVKLAVQVLSSSVSTALTVCEKIGLPQFQGSSATSKFAKIMDRIYDALNSHAGGKGFKSPLASWNKHIWKKLFSDATAYLMNLKRKSDNTLLYKTKRSTFVIGLIVCMKSLESIMDEIVLQKDTSLIYLPTYKLSTDPLELFFSALRQRFGNNNNPNAIQLEFAVKRMLAVKIKPNIMGNCLARDNESFVRLSSLTNLNVGNSFENEENEDITFLPDYSILSSYVSNVVTYIAGFVGRKVAEEVYCSSCVESLYPSDLDVTKLRSDFVLIGEKDNGDLFIPSDDLVSVCRVTESTIRIVQEKGTKGLISAVLIKRTLQQVLQMPIFLSLREVNNEEHEIFGNHIFTLIKKIISLYIKIRLHHICKEVTMNFNTESIRNHLTKTILFRGQ